MASRLLLLLVLLAAPLAAHAAFQTRSPATCISFDIGNPNWSNPDRAQTSNDSDATATVNDNQTTDALVCLQYGFSIPAGATILGIIVRVERRATAGGSPKRDALMRILKGGVAEPADRSTATSYTTGDVVEDHGGATDLWGTAWTDADINDANFGAAFAAQKAGGAGGAATVSVDHMQIEVHYTQPPPAPTLVSPADGATETTSTPTFTWNAVVDPDGDTVTYELQADDSGCGFASPEVNQSALASPSFAPGAALPDGAYCWRVRAVDQNGAAGPWSATRSFTISAAPVLSQSASPSACASVGGFGTQAWSNAGNAVSSNNSYASVTLDGQTSNYLRCLGYGFSIPPGATILGIEVNVERKSNRTSNGGSDDASVRLVKAGVVQGADRETDVNYTTGDVVWTHGTSTDLWGSAWTPAEINAADFGAAFAATKPSGAGASHTVTVDHIFITVYYSMPAVIIPAAFNAFEAGTAVGAITGVITTKVAGAPFSLDVVAISGGAQMAAFTNAVTVELLGNTVLGTPLDAQNCPTSSTLVQTVSPDPTVTAGRSTVSFAAVANAWRDVRVRVSYPVGAPTVIACSTDNFAIRPASFSVAASDADWQTPGTARVLANVGAAGGTVHRAGRSFTLTVTPSPLTATSYDGDPIVSAASCTLPAGCTTGTLALGAFASVGGARVSNSATYSEAGAFDLTLVDQAYASVDAADTVADCSATGRYVCQSPAPASIGRFVPDRFELTALAQPVFRTFDALDASCSVPPAGPRRSFTYVGQPFGYATAPSATVVAQNAAGATTTNYRGVLWKLTAAGVAQSAANAPVLALDASQIGAATLTETPDTGTGTLTAAAGDKLAFVRNAASPSAPFTANLALTWDISDASEAGAGQGTIGTAAALVFDGGGAGIGFDSGADFRYGRLRLTNANGSQLVPLPVPMEAQYFAGAAGFVTNVADNCTAVATASIGLGTYTGNLAAGETALSGGGALTAGRRTLLLSAPGSANDGSVILTANLGATHSYLQGNWTGAAYDDNPTARATFGTVKGAGEVIYMRENF